MKSGLSLEILIQRKINELKNDLITYKKFDKKVLEVRKLLEEDNLEEVANVLKCFETKI